ncbi:E3 ubiquitin-protein ligase RNF4 [Neltuma alba]|uniref:E3 ubiquitin-protein ligase RNF4 n=1 Tax=Neltuma alba TaxID=207710 RepID=UPI0010A35796|nr:E3 ubiquitin-protein ligase RNF4-like [Prosopis alba]
MSTHSVGGDSPGSQQRGAVLGLDLNRAPPRANHLQEGPSVVSESRVVQAVQQPQFMQPIDVEATDDDVIESTRSAFVEARNNSRRNRGRTIIDVDLDHVSQVTEISPNDCRGDSLCQTVPNCDVYINLEGSSSSEREENIKSTEPPKEPVFHCPICTKPFVEEVLTRCGHIFCKRCIKDTLKAQGKCPTCEQKVTAKGLIRVFLPSTGSP